LSSDESSADKVYVCCVGVDFTFCWVSELISHIVIVLALTYCGFGLSDFFIMRLFSLFLLPLFHFEFITSNKS